MELEKGVTPWTRAAKTNTIYVLVCPYINTIQHYTTGCIKKGEFNFTYWDCANG